MAVQITNSFITDFEAELVHTFQRRGSMLRGAVRTKDSVVGSSTTFQRIGTGTATTKARHGTITPMNQTHTAIPCTLEDFYAGDWVDKLDEAKINIQERQAIAQGGAWALGRKVDSQLLAAMDGTTQTVIDIDETDIATYLASAIEWTEAMDANSVPNDGQRFASITPRLHSQLTNNDKFASADFVDNSGTPFRDGSPVMMAWRDWQNVKWKVLNETDTMAFGTAAAKNFMWHKSAVGYAIAASAGNVAGNNQVAADITWHGDRAAHFVNNMMSGGACLIDDNGVIEASHDDTTPIRTS